MISIIIPANNEQGYIKSCLESLLASEGPLHTTQVIVVANGCQDETVAQACQMIDSFATVGWQLDVIDLKEGSKIKALNAGDLAALHPDKAYIDADIQVTKHLIAELVTALDQPAPTYASGTINVPPARSYISRRYAEFWQKLPFIAKGVPGCGVFALNAAGRARWDRFPDVISDDTFVRFHFSADEMRKVPVPFDWPITEGFANLVRVRRRQNIGLDEMRRLYPELAARTEVTAPSTVEKLRLFTRDPIGFMIYAAVAITVKLPVFHNRSRWDRGR